MLSIARRCLYAGARARHMSTTISGVRALEIIDSRGNPTVEVTMDTSNGLSFTAAVPSGASTGIYEAVELRDGDQMRFGGKGVLKAVENVNSVLGPAVIGMDPADQVGIDGKMLQIDGTTSKSNMGANAILGVSLAAAKCGAAAQGVPLYSHLAALAGYATDSAVMPVPSLNVINGGSHAGNALPFQEFMILPTGAKSFSEALRMGCETYQQLKGVIKEKYGQDAVNVGDEGGFAPPIEGLEEGLELLSAAIERAGHTGKITLGLDAAASEFYAGDGIYDLNFKENGGPSKDSSHALDRAALGDLYVDLCERYPLVSVEDPFDQDDVEGWVDLTARIGDKVQIVGDDLLVTNTARIEPAVAGKWCNALLLKVNQIGSVTESSLAVNMTKQAGWGCMTSHRSGETEDTFIADLAVGLRTGQIKTGAPCRSERLAKYNQLLRIEADLLRRGVDVTYAGANFFKPWGASEEL